MRLSKVPHQIISDLYDGGLDDLAWRRGVHSLMNMIGGASACIFSIDALKGVVLDADAHEVEDEIIQRFARDWADKDLRLGPVLQRPSGVAMFDRMLLPMNVWRASPIYNEFLREIDRPWILSTWLFKGPTRSRLLTIHGSRRRGPMDERDGDVIMPFVPHLRRALDIRERVLAANVRAQTLASSIDQLGFGVVILDARGRLLEVNGMAQALMRQSSGISRARDGTLRLRGPAGPQLHRWLQARTPPPESRDGVLRVARPAASPLSITVTALPAVMPAWSTGERRWLLLIFDPESRLAARAELIQSELQISPREAEVAGLLVRGFDLRQVAQRLNISPSTARTHLKAIFAKTGMRSQVDLVRRIASGPLFVHAQPQGNSGEL